MNESNVTIVNTIELVESILTHSIVFSIDTLSSRVTTGECCTHQDLENGLLSKNKQHLFFLLWLLSIYSKSFKRHTCTHEFAK